MRNGYKNELFEIKNMGNSCCNSESVAPKVRDVNDYVKNKIISGKEFKELANKMGWTLVKYLHSNNLEIPQSSYGGNFHYKYGLNKPTYVEIDLYTSCCGGGLYFTYLESEYHKRDFKFSVTVPDDARVLLESGRKFKTDKLIILKEI